ncbi:MAG: hypothetical protein V3V17_07935 [Alphaproteobacteria bacterium]
MKIGLIFPASGQLRGGQELRADVMACDGIVSVHWARLAEGIAQVIGVDNPAYQAARTAARSGRADHFVRANQLLRCYSETVRDRVRQVAQSDDVRV